MSYQRFTVEASDANAVYGRPYFSAPEQKYPPELRGFLGITPWQAGDRTRIGTRDFKLPKIGVTLRVSAGKTRTLWLLCGNRFIDSAITNLPGKRLYGQEILDAFLSQNYFGA